MTTFNLTIKLGNDAMQTGVDVSRALDEVSNDLREVYGRLKESGTIGIIDDNGNKVGEWSVS